LTRASAKPLAPASGSRLKEARSGLTYSRLYKEPFIPRSAVLNLRVLELLLPISLEDAKRPGRKRQYGQSDCRI